MINSALWLKMKLKVVSNSEIIAIYLYTVVPFSEVSSYETAHNRAESHQRSYPGALFGSDRWFQRPTGLF